MTRKADGLAYRLTWRRSGIVPKKRVRPSSRLPPRRKLVYRLRYWIARMSHPIFRLSRWVGMRSIYLSWARSTLRLHQAVTWSRGRLGRLLDALLPVPEQ